MRDKRENFTSGHRLVRNVVWNLLGAGLPMLVAIVAIPMLIEGLGLARFGVLTLAWMVVGYFSLFDLGLGRALTKLVAEKLGKGQNEEIPALFWAAILLMTTLGVLGAAFLALLAPWLVGGVLKIPTELQPETLKAFYLLAASIPIVVSTTGLRGVLEAHQRFGLINAVRIPLGIFTFLGPVALLPFSNSLVPVVAALVVARLVFWCIYAVLCMHVDPTLRKFVRARQSTLKPLISFGGWMTVTNLVGPIMVYLDRFLIGNMVTMVAVTFYVTPYEVVTKIGIIPAALMGVMFPAFAAVFAQDRIRAASLFAQVVNYVFLALFPVTLVIVLYAREGLTLWLGADFANNSTLVLQFLAVGIFINCHAHVPFGLVQSAGRPDITAKLHLIELPFYLFTIWWLIDVYGIVGAALSWMIRAMIDAVVLFVIANRLLSPVPPSSSFRPAILAILALFVFALGAVIPSPAIKSMFMAGVLVIFAAIAWFIILTSDERGMVRNRLKITPVFK